MLVLLCGVEELVAEAGGRVQEVGLVEQPAQRQQREQRPRRPVQQVELLVLAGGSAGH